MFENERVSEVQERGVALCEDRRARDVQAS